MAARASHPPGGVRRRRRAWERGPSARGARPKRRRFFQLEERFDFGVNTHHRGQENWEKAPRHIVRNVRARGRRSCLGRASPEAHLKGGE